MLCLRAYRRPKAKRQRSAASGARRARASTVQGWVTKVVGFSSRIDANLPMLASLALTAMAIEPWSELCLYKFWSKKTHGLLRYRCRCAPRARDGHCPPRMDTWLGGYAKSKCS